MTETGPFESQPNHEPLTDERLGELLAGLGNHEGKALLTIGMASQGAEVYLSPYHLHHLLEGMVNDNAAYMGDRRNQGDWCSESLVPIGVVAKADYGSPLQYAITNEGIKYGKPLAGLLLDFADRHQIPLVHLFGTSRSRAQRSPLLRFQMIQEILTHPGELTESELLEPLGGISPGTPRNLLLNLAAAGLLKYDSWNMAKDDVRFEIVDENYIPDGRIGELGLTLIDYLKLNKSATLDQLLADLRQRLQVMYPDKNDSQLRRDINISLLGYKKRGVLKGQGRGQAELKVSMTAKQEEMWTELLNLLNRFQEQSTDFIDECNKLADEYLHDPSKVAQALNRGFEASSLAKNGSEKDLEKLVSKILSKHTGALAVRDIVDLIAVEEGRQLSQWGVRATLQSMLAKDSVVASGKKGRTYRLVQASTSTD